MSAKLKWQLAVGFLLVFLAGAALGTWAGAWHAREAFVGRHGRAMAERMREQMRRQLELTPEQAREIDPILDRMADRLQQIRRESGRRVADAMNDTHRELAPHLNPAQQARLEEFKERHHRQMRARHGGVVPPPPDDQ